MHNSGVDLDVLQLWNDSELDGDSLTESETLGSLHREHDGVEVLILVRQLTWDGVLSNLEWNSESES